MNKQFREALPDSIKSNLLTYKTRDKNSEQLIMEYSHRYSVNSIKIKINSHAELLNNIKLQIRGYFL